MTLNNQKSQGEIIKDTIMDTIIASIAVLPEVEKTTVINNEGSFSKTIKVWLVDNDDYEHTPISVDVNIG